MKIFLWSRYEKASALGSGAALVLGVASSLVTLYTAAAINIWYVATPAAALFVLASLSWVFLITRDAFTLRGREDVFAYAMKLIEGSRNRILTVRTQLGQSEAEREYVRTLLNRVNDARRPLAEFRRIVRLGENSKAHLNDLIDRISRQEGVDVRVFQGAGPQLDFMVVDNEVAVVAFPDFRGDRTYSGVVLRNREAIDGVVDAFERLRSESVELFEGDPHVTDDARQKLREKVGELLGAPQRPAAGA
jgi:drug/metabolite transporter superfamily protein YnfA